MSVNISLSNNKGNGCKNILEKLKLLKIDARTIETLSLVDHDYEKGCLITVGSKYILKKDLSNLWDEIKKDYGCCHLQIDGIFNGCIYNYIGKDLCKDSLCKN